MSTSDRELLAEAERLSQKLLVAAGELGAFAQQLRQATEQMQEHDSEREGLDDGRT